MEQGRNYLPLPEEIRYTPFKKFKATLSTRFINAMDRAGIENLDELFVRDLRQIRSIKGVGHICIFHLDKLLTQYGIDLDHYFKHSGKPIR